MQRYNVITAQGDAVVTDVEGVRSAVENCGVDNVLCVVTTTSCFAPRLPDKVQHNGSSKTELQNGLALERWSSGRPVERRHDFCRCHFFSFVDTQRAFTCFCVVGAMSGGRPVAAGRKELQ